jgi:hypothetical protein
MKLLGVLGIISLFGALCPAPLAAHDCGHHGNCNGNCYGDCQDCDHHGHYAAPRASPFRGSGAAGAAVDLRALEGKIAEVIYLPGSTPETGMVEIRLQADGQMHLVRLAPAGFLKHGGLRLREGETAAVKGFAVAGMEGDLFVASEVRAGDKTLSLRDARGLPAW